MSTDETEPTFTALLYERRGRVALITLNRPEKLNAWTLVMEGELIAAIGRANHDTGVGAIVITGAGRGFCAGADISGWSQRLARAEEPPPGAPLLTTVASSEVPVTLTTGKPVIAAINGPAIGVGLTLTLSCDIRLASEAARFSARFVRVGLTPECGSTRYLPLVAGLPNALFLALTGRIIDAQEALARRLVDHLVPQERLLDEALALGEEIAANPLDAVWTAKRLLHQNALEQDLRRVVTLENYSIRDLQRQPAYREAVAAFLERREPRFNV